MSEPAATDDLELLRQFIRDHSQAAFTELVKRHVNLVYSAALRQVRSPQLAEEVAQSVFADLARDAAKLKPDTVLTAWLYAVTRRTAIDVVRKESRRQLREQIAVEMNAMNATEASWTDIEPLLDEAVAALDDTDRAAVLLRYFENKSLRDVGQQLGVGDDAAQKRVSRAVEQLREFFAKRGVTVGASGLVIVISANAVQAAPVGLAVTISAALAGTAVTASTVIAATKTVAMTTLQKTLVTATVAVLAGVGIYEARQAAQLRDQVQTLLQQQAPLAEQIQQLQRERDDATNRLAGFLVENSRSKSNPNQNELLKLRGEVGSLRQVANEAKQKAEVAEKQLSEALSYKAQFTKREDTAVKNIKILDLAMRIHAVDNDGTFSNDISQLTNELASVYATKEESANGYEKIRSESDNFEFINTGLRKLNPKDGTIVGPANMVSLRERIARQAPDGTWRRIYVLADGYVINAVSIDGNFDAWEKANTYSPVPSPDQ